MDKKTNNTNKNIKTINQPFEKKDNSWSSAKPKTNDQHQERKYDKNSENGDSIDESHTSNSY